MSKKIVSLILAISFCLMAAVTAYAATPSIAVSNVEAERGQEVTVVISLADNPGIVSMKLLVKYDTNVLEYQSSTIGSEFSDITGATTNLTENNGNIILNWVVLSTENKNCTANGTFAEIKFKVKDNAAKGDSVISVTYDEDDVYNVKEENISFAVNNGKVTVHEEENTGSAALTVATATGKAGEEVTVSINTKENMGMAYLGFTVDYDTTKLKLTGYEDSGMKSWVANKDKGTFVWSDTADYTGVGEILKLQFKIMDDESDEIAYVRLTEISAFDENENDVKIVAEEGGVDIIARVSVFNIATVTGRAGEEAIISISTKDNPGIAFAQFTIEYDKTLLEFTGYEESGMTSWVVNDEKGIFLWSDTTDYTGVGEILRLKFKVADGASDGMAYVKLTETSAFNENENKVKIVAEEGGVSIVNRVPGDVNGDGIVDGRDAIRLGKYLAKIDVEIDIANSDVTGDGKIDGRDLIRLKKYLAKMPVELV